MQNNDDDDIDNIDDYDDDDDELLATIAMCLKALKKYGQKLMRKYLRIFNQHAMVV